MPSAHFENASVRKVLIISPKFFLAYIFFIYIKFFSVIISPVDGYVVRAKEND